MTRRASPAAPHEHEFISRGHRWRVQSDGRGKFDEIVVVTGRDPQAGRRDCGLILHAEMMSNRSCFVDVAGLCLWVWVDADGVARIANAEDRRSQPRLPAEVSLRDATLDIEDDPEAVPREGAPTCAVRSQASTMKYDRQQPCESCPYRRDAPIGLWHRSEFQKLLATEKSELGAIFMCHEGRKLPVDERRLCLGWLINQRSRGCPSIALRMRLCLDEHVVLLLKTANADGLRLYDSVEQMCRANGVRPRPDPYP